MLKAQKHKIMSRSNNGQENRMMIKHKEIMETIKLDKTKGEALLITDGGDEKIMGDGNMMQTPTCHSVLMLHLQPKE